MLESLYQDYTNVIDLGCGSNSPLRFVAKCCIGWVLMDINYQLKKVVNSVHKILIKI